MWLWCVGAVAAAVFVWGLCRRLLQSAPLEFRGKHFLITGGSVGLGKAIADLAVAAGAKVTLVARNQGQLDEACTDLTRRCPPAHQPPRVLACPGDVTKPAEVARFVEQSVAKQGNVDFLICCAGTAKTGYFLDNDLKVFRDNMELNYFGSVNVLKEVVPHMTANGGGHVVLVSSGLGLCGYMGYSAYAPTKWALRGLCDVLRNELLSRNIHMHISYPPNMDTPGYQVENASKPAETQAIESGETTYKPEAVASAFMASLRAGDYHLDSGDFGITLLTAGMSGISPRANALFDMLISPLIVPVGRFYQWTWDRCARAYKR